VSCYRTIQDPYLYRCTLLDKVHLARWSAGRSRASSRLGPRAAWRSGQIAVVEFDDEVCAQVVELARNPEGTLGVRRVVCVVDPDTVVAQMEGSIVQALGAGSWRAMRASGPLR